MDYSKENNKRRKRRAKNKTKRVSNKIAVYVFRTAIIVLLVGGFALAGTLVGAYMGILENAPELSDIQELSMSFTTIIRDSNGEEFDRLSGAEDREYATKDMIPKNVKNAFVSIEDERFYNHNGVDYKGFVRAMWENIKSLGDENATTQGASTITQQLIKNKIGLMRNTIITKLQEQYLAIHYEEELTALYGSTEAAKDYILELYLNVISLGDNTYGVQAAALNYFGKDVSEVTLEESCIIAAITQNPFYNNPFRDPVKNSKRAQTALDKMLELGFITQKEYDAADLDAAYASILSTKQAVAEQSSYHSYYVDQVTSEIIKDLMKEYKLTSQEASTWIYQAGLDVFTNMDPVIQAIVDEAYMSEEWFPQNEYCVEILYTLSTRNTLTNAVTHHPTKREFVPTFDDVEAAIEGLRDKMLGPDDAIDGEVYYASPQPQGSFAIIDQYTGKVVAISGGRGEKLTNRSFNRATTAERHPGSVFKVLSSFLPALDMGLITPGTVIDDVPYIYADNQNYSPSNWWGKTYRGLNTVRVAIRDSMNGITVKNMYDTGMQNCFNYLLNLGFTTLAPEDGYHLSTALGGLTTGVTSVETAAAYAAIANGGTYIEPTFYTKVLDHNGNVLLEKVPESYTVIKATTAYLLTDMMKDVVTAGTGTRARFSELKMPIAGKTGTSSDTIDLTFAGYTPYYTASIWMGYDMPKKMSDKSSYDHLYMWGHIMEEIHKALELEYTDFERPSGITSARICTISGKLAVEGLCDVCELAPRAGRVRNELFAAGTAPTEYCTQHMEYTVCTESGKLPHENCPAELVQTKVGFVRLIPFEGEEPVEDKIYEVPKGVLDGEICDIHEHLIDPETGQPFDPDNPNLPFIGDPTLPGGATQPPANTDAPVMPTPTPYIVPTPTPIPTPDEGYTDDGLPIIVE